MDGRQRRYICCFALLFALLLALLAANLSVGSVRVTVPELLEALRLRGDGGTSARIVWSLRLPRMLAAALRDNGRATIVGERTFGKAAVQDFFPVPGRPGAAFRLTVARYVTPSGAAIHGAGLEPEEEEAEDGGKSERQRILDMFAD